RLRELADGLDGCPPGELSRLVVGRVGTTARPDPELRRDSDNLRPGVQDPVRPVTRVPPRILYHASATRAGQHASRASRTLSGVVPSFRPQAYYPVLSPPGVGATPLPRSSGGNDKPGSGIPSRAFPFHLEWEGLVRA